MPGDRNNLGGIIGINPSSSDRSVMKNEERDDVDIDTNHAGTIGISLLNGNDTKVRIIKA